MMDEEGQGVYFSIVEKKVEKDKAAPRKKSRKR